ncbi:MAG: flavin reductase family protein [Gemmatimonadaceae bacterium]|nr:flavin reductase family protein [Gloeobacterales cyanobacterium ES-bin-141]
MSSTSENLGPALGKIPSGIFIITAQKNDQSSGMLASWVQQAGFEPPSLTVAVKKDRPFELLVSEVGDGFVVNVLARENGKLAGHFGKGFAPGEPAFEGVATETATTGTPVLSEAVAFLDCRVTGRLEGGDHWVILGEVVDGCLRKETEPWVHTRKNGFSY